MSTARALFLQGIPETSDPIVHVWLVTSAMIIPLHLEVVFIEHEVFGCWKRRMGYHGVWMW